MSEVVIRAENLGKRYTLGQTRERYTTLRDVLAKQASSLKRNLLGDRRVSPPHKEEFWALRDVSFEVRQGDVVGIIGRNGAGKSTLLKILSRITEPTTGRVIIQGRVASLLEVGTGFHPELTGRENIFLNGAILGMSKAEIRRKFDEIVAFAEVERFLDTPVKRFSSGMYVRLAFAVAAHLEPEILVVDEVLAVGDASFQKKCLGKMQDVAQLGKAIEARLADHPAIALDHEILAFTWRDGDHRGNPLLRLGTFAVWQGRPIGHRPRIAQDRMERVNVGGHRWPQPKPLCSDLDHDAPLADSAVRRKFGWAQMIPRASRSARLAESIPSNSP